MYRSKRHEGIEVHVLRRSTQGEREREGERGRSPCVWQSREIRSHARTHTQAPEGKKLSVKAGQLSPQSPLIREAKRSFSFFPSHTACLCFSLCDECVQV